jgi:DNA-binding transcriptional MerR regulator
METKAVGSGEREWRVGEVARLARVTVRTLHHYDEIGLLRPSGRTQSGYRRYSGSDLHRLHQVLLFRELGFTLETIQQLLDDPAWDRRRALESQRELLEERRKRLDTILRAVEGALNELAGGGTMTADEIFAGLGEFQAREYAEEARERWGETDAYKESMRRTRRYTKEDWVRIKAEGSEGLEAMATLMAAGRSAEGPEAMDLAETARQHITRWFYECSPDFHRGLADMYEADARFGACYEKQATGLTKFVAAAIRANADRQNGRMA